MKEEDVLANKFLVEYDEEAETLKIYPYHLGCSVFAPIRLSREMLEKMGKDEACRWIGQKIALLVPRLRSDLFNLK